jgi:membrane protease YdiL (CAAX protease family)
MAFLSGPETNSPPDVPSSAGDASSVVGPLMQPPAWRRRLARIWSGLSRAVLFAVMSFLLWWLCAWALQEEPWIENELMWTVFSLFPAALATSVLLLRLGGGQTLQVIGIPFDWQAFREATQGLFWGVGIGLAVVGVQYLAGWVAFEPAVDYSLPNEDGVFVWTPSLWLGIAVLGIGAAGEELLFRGYGFQQLIRATGPWAAIAATSLIFGLMHGSNPDASAPGIANTALFGGLFGLALVRLRSWWAPFGMHFGWNATLATIGANVSGLRIKLAGVALTPYGPEIWTGGDYGPEGSLLTSFAVVAVGFILWRLPPARQDPRLWD